MAGRSSPPIVISSPTTRRRITAERPVNIRTIERYLLLAGDLPGLKFKNSIKPHPTKAGAAILVVEVTEKPVDIFGRVDNRGTHARGPLEYLTSVTANNWLRMHEALTLTSAGAFQTRELQFYSATYRQVLTGEGLTFFANASYGLGCPDLGLDQHFLLYKTRSLYLESGLTYPIIRARERNLNVAGLTFASEDHGIFFDLPETPPSTLDRLRGFRMRAEGDSANPPAASISSFSSSARASRASAAPRTAATSRRAPTGGSISPRWS